MIENDLHNDREQDEGLAGQRLHLASLESCEERIGILRDQECDLEVEAIATQAALRSATTRLQPGIDAALALRIGRVLERRHESEQRQRDGSEDHRARSPVNTRQVDRIRAGIAALQAWRDASQPREPGRVITAAKVTLLIATIVTVWAAFAIHLAFLLLLVVVIGPVSFAMERGRDKEWHRVGARRRFQAAGLADLAEWNDECVAERIAELRSVLENSHRSSTRPGNEAERVSAPDAEADESASAREDSQLASDLAAAGLSVEDTQGDVGEWLRLVARADRSRESLNRVKTERAQLRAEAAEHRDHLLHYLQSRGVKPTQVPDTAAAIAAGLERLSHGS